MSNSSSTLPARPIWRHFRRRTASARRYSTFASLLLITPLLLVMTLGFVYPVGRMLLSSLYGPDFTFIHFERVFAEPLYTRILWRTFRIALLVAIFGLLIGYPIAYMMARLRSNWAVIVAVCVLIPLWTSVLVRSYAWIVLLQRNGVVNSLLVGSGITDQPLRMLYTEGVVLFAMTHVLLPFMILPLYTAIKSIPDDLPRAALNLGASPVSVFAHVIFPLSLPGVFAGSLLTFILALGFYVTPALVGGPQTMMMATLIGQQATVLLNWPFASALATVLLIVTLLIAFGFRRLLALNKGFSNEI